MAWTKRQLSTLPLLISAILLLCTANVIRSSTTEKYHILKDSDLWTAKAKATDHGLSSGGPRTEKRADGSPEMNDLEENCNNADDEEDCLMRRELAAHVDYIYTQQHDP